MARYICIHGHFYQPPREDPWIEAIERQDSAAPYHDWNERIAAECYAVNAFSRLYDAEERIADIVNNYSRISFNFGPTLLSWLEKNRADIYEAILEADKESQSRFNGHGSALAQAYNHMILPLANRRDKRTQVRWGIADFQARFGRYPEGMWLPETAVDTETLEVLAEHDILFTILAQHQAARLRAIGRGDWEEMNNGQVDPTRPYTCSLPSGRSITCFFYDGPVSSGVAFGNLLRKGDDLAEHLGNVFSEERTWPQLVHIAVDGETFGHHYREGSRTLVDCLQLIEEEGLAEFTNYGEYLSRHPPEWEVKIVDNSSWSCIHGIERWRSDCGCCAGGHQSWRQTWRRPLREAMDRLRDALVPLFEQETAVFLKNPWEARDDYIQCILERSPSVADQFYEKHAGRELDPEEKTHVLKLMEVQRHAMLMFTSCGWFFDEISGIEGTQILKYADRAIELTGETLGVDLEFFFTRILRKAASNISEFQNGASLYQRFIRPQRKGMKTAALHVAVSILLEPDRHEHALFSHNFNCREKRRLHKSGHVLCVGLLHGQSVITLEEEDFLFAALHFGGVDVRCCVASSNDEIDFGSVAKRLEESFNKGNSEDTLAKMRKILSQEVYSFQDLLHDEQRRLLQIMLDRADTAATASLGEALGQHRSIAENIRNCGMAVPKNLTAAVAMTLNADLLSFIRHNPLDEEALAATIREIRGWSAPIDRSMLGREVGRRVGALLEEVIRDENGVEPMGNALRILRTIAPLKLDLDLWHAQNVYFTLKKTVYSLMMEETGTSTGEESDKWIETFQSLGPCLNISRLP